MQIPISNVYFLDSIKDGTIRPLSELCQGISQDSALAIVDYAQSSSVIDFVQRNYGNQVFLKMMQDSASGLDCEKIVSSSLGISLSQLDTNWLNSFSENKPTISSSLLATILWIAIPTLLIVAGVLVLVLRRKKNSKAQEN